MTNKHEPILLSTNTSFTEEHDNLTLKHEQYISPQFLDDLKDARYESTANPAGEFHKLASIPTSIAEEWLREGFNLWEATPTEVIRRLKNENLDYFIATNKRI